MIGGSSIKLCIQAKATARRSNFAITGNVSATGAPPNAPMASIAFVDHVTVSGNTQPFATTGGRSGPASTVRHKRR